MFGTESNDESLKRTVISTELLASREPRARDFRRESEALSKLADVFAQSPDDLGQALAQAALLLTGAHAAGLSVEERGMRPSCFRWVATAGTYSRYLNGTIPGEQSPCAEVKACKGPLLMRDPHLIYPHLRELHEPVHELLLVPFHTVGTAAGAVWVVSHNDDVQFDREDLRIVGTLTRFAAAAMHQRDLVLMLSDAHARQREADARKDRFLAILAHEMRSPLSAISLATEVIKRRGEDPARREAAIASIERQTGQLVGLVSDITDAVAIRSGKLSLTLAPVTVEEVIARALEACREQLQTRRQQLELDLPKLPVILMGDLMRLTQILVNLLNNAIKYTPDEGHIAIRVTTEADFVRLDVSDTGQGLSPQAQEGIFDMFAQVPMDDRPLNSGLGIGLALVKQLVELHHGDVYVRSEGLGRGCTFTVRLPGAGVQIGPH